MPKLKNISNGTVFLEFKSKRTEILLPFDEVNVSEEELAEEKIARKTRGRKPTLLVKR